MARGELVAFLDADDIWYPRKLELVVAAFDEDPSLVLVNHDAHVVREDGTHVKDRAYRPDVDHMYEYLLYVGNVITTSAVTARLDVVLAECGFSEEPRYLTTEDYDLWLRLALRGRFRFLHEFLSEYVLYAGSMSAKLERSYDNIVNVVEDHFHRLAAEGRLDRYRAWRRVARSRGGLTRDLIKAGSFGRALVQAARVPGFAWRKWRLYGSWQRLGASAHDSASSPSGSSSE